VLRPAAALLLLAFPLLAGCSKDVPAAPIGDAGFRLEGLPGSFEQPVFLGHAGDGSGRLYVVEQRGTIQVLDGGSWSTFLDLSAEVLDQGEQGMLGLAFHPDYETNGRLFVHYTDTSGDTAVSELRRDDATHADEATERLLLHVDDPYSNHNGGMIAFGPDGYLYIGLGDGGSGGDPQNRAQSLDTLLGKILRIDVDGPSTLLQPYAIPADNPFVGRDGRDEIWAYGLRNPWRFSFDRQTDDLWIGDVGQNKYEEVDVQRAASDGGENYGWSRFEGNHVYDADRQAPGAVMPVAEYDQDGGHCAVTGGYVYRGSAIPSLQGTYVFGDYCSGYLWTLAADGSAGYRVTRVMDSEHHVSSFGEDEAGELYVVDHGGSVLKFVAA
jgi:glucose/arabinose dehydrogenase